MPPYFIPAKSGVHRVACLALYRSLVRRSSELPIDQHQQHAFRQLIRNVFLKNVKIQSPRQIVAALNLGYQSLETLQHVSSKPVQIVSDLLERLTGTQSPHKENDSDYSPKSRPSVETKESRKASPVVPIVWPRPDTPLVLSRPFLSISGKRHIPKLVNTNGIPHLRFKKPQSPFLSRVIRDKIRQREKRFDQLTKMNGEIAMAQAEDEWDSILKHNCGIEDNPELSWTTVLVSASQQIRGKIHASHLKNTELGRKMYDIVEKEKALAKEEQEGMVGDSASNPSFHKMLSVGST
ncbi:hypothetical protein MMC11_003039 [Xylographa trunciseda]|nr:hypothetical protein [Xylographa trunciseda]